VREIPEYYRVACIDEGEKDNRKKKKERKKRFLYKYWDV